MAHTSKVDTKLEVLVIPVGDVDRSKEFYQGLGSRVIASRQPSHRSTTFAAIPITSAKKRATPRRNANPGRHGSWPADPTRRDGIRHQTR
jgi:hypothetical protein